MVSPSHRQRSSADRRPGPVLTGLPDGAREYRYDAFISYSRDASQELATTLQRWLERFATPWYRPRSLRIFRDFTNLTAGDSLSQGLRDAMADSRNFILVAAPEAASSKWVGQEVAWWAEHRSSANFFIVLAGGSLVWRAEDGDWDWTRTDALPRSARGLFEREPVWVDLSRADPRRGPDNKLLNDVAQIAAPLRGADKDTLFGEHLDLHRRAQRQRRGAVATLAFLLVVALIATFAAVDQARIARDQRDTAQQERDMAVSRLLSLKSQDFARSDPRTAAQLLIAANRLSGQNEQARVALANLMLNSPWAGSVVAHNVAVTAMAVRPDGTTVTSVGADRTVTSWDTARNRAPARSALPGSGNLDTVALAIAPNALVAATIDGRPVADTHQGTFTDLQPIDVWDLGDGTATGRSIEIPLTRGGGTAPVLAFSADAGRLAVAEGRTVSIWALPTAGDPTLIGRVSGPSLPGSEGEPKADALAFSPDGSRLAFLGVISLSLWDVTGPKARLLDSVVNVPLVPPLLFAPDGKTLAVGGEGQRGATLRVAVSDRGRLEVDWDHVIELSGATAFHPTSRSLTIGDNRGRIGRWPGRGDDWPGPVDQDLSAGSNSVTALTYLPDGRLAAASATGEITLWGTPGDRYRPTEVPAPALGGRKPDRVVFSAGLRTMATTTGVSTTFWDTTGRETPRRINSVAGIDPVFLTERRVLTTMPDAAADPLEGRILLSDFSGTGRPRSLRVPLQGHPSPIGNTGLVVANSALADEWNATAQIWQLPADGRPSARLADLPAYADVLSERIVISYGLTPRLWDVRGRAGGPVSRPFEPAQDPDHTGRLSPDGRTYVAASRGNIGRTTLWDLSDPARMSMIATLPGTLDRGLWAAAFSGDSKLLATGLSMGSLALWDVADPRRPVKLSEMTSPTDTEGRLRELGPPLALSADGNSLLAGEVDGAIVLWDVSDPRNPARVTTFPIPGHDEPAISFSPDGDVVAVGDTLWRIGELNRLRAAPWELACERAGSGLTESEWRLHAPGLAYRETC